MSEFERLTEEQLDKVTGGDDMVDAAKELLEQEREAELRAQQEALEKHYSERTSTELSDNLNTLLGILKTITTPQ